MADDGMIKTGTDRPGRMTRTLTIPGKTETGNAGIAVSAKQNNIMVIIVILVPILLTTDIVDTLLAMLRDLCLTSSNIAN